MPSSQRRTAHKAIPPTAAITTKTAIAARRKRGSARSTSLVTMLPNVRNERAPSGVRSIDELGRTLAIDRQLSSESSLVRGSRLTTGDIGGEVRIFVEDAR